MSETPVKRTVAKRAPATRTAAKKAPAKKAAVKKTAAKKAPARKTAARKAPARKTTPTPVATPVAKAARRSPAERAVDVGAQAVTTAALIQKVAHETAERVAAETAARVSEQYDAAIAELTRTLDKNTKRALKSVRTAADMAQSASPLKGKKKKK